MKDMKPHHTTRSRLMDGGGRRSGANRVVGKASNGREFPTSDLLLPHHRQLLDDSAISLEVAADRGYRSVTTKAELKRLGFTDRQCRVPALLIPIHGVTRGIVNYQIRPDEPRVSRNGKPIKYETVAGSKMALDVPPLVRKRLGDPSTPLCITEGARKADAAVAQGLCCIGVLGVWNWRGTNERGGITVLADWEAIHLKGRKVYLVFDSDVTEKQEVHAALVRLKKFLESRGANVRVIYLPPGDRGVKMGLDDFFATGHTVDDLLSRAVTQLRHPRLEEEPGPYLGNEAGLFWNKSGDETPVPLTNSDCRIVENVLQNDGMEESRLLDIEVKLKGRTQRFTLPAQQFSGMNWTLEYLGPEAIVHPGFGTKERARVAIQTLSGDIPRKSIFTHTGWRRVGGVWVYLHAGGTVGTVRTEIEAEVLLREELARFHLPTPPSGELLVKATKASLRFLDLAPEAISYPLFGAIFRSIIGSNRQSIHLSGPTGTGKTEIAALAQQHFGQEMHANNLPANWSSTDNALETLAFLAKDTLLVIDDFAPCGTSYDVARWHQKADRIFRAQGNLSGRQRLRSDGSLRPVRPPRGMILSTGEDIPRGQSIQARVLIIEVSPQHLNWDLLTTCQQEAASGFYAQTTSAFIQWLAERYETVQGELKTRLQGLRQEAVGTDIHRRTPDIISNLALGWDYFLDFAEEKAAITPRDREGLWQQAWEALGNAALSQVQHLVSSNPTERFLELLRAALASGRAHLADIEGCPPERPEACGWRQRQQEPQPQGERIGWVQGEDLYLEQGASFAAAQKIGRDGGEALVVGKTTLFKRLDEGGLLASKDASRQRLTVRRSIEGAQRAVVHLRVESLLPIKPAKLSTPSQNDAVDWEEGVL